MGPAARPEEPLRRSGEATASLILGLFSFIPVIALLAVIFGHLARASIRRSGGRLLGKGMAAGGLLLGYLGLGAWVIYGLSFLIHPFLPSTRRAENEQSAVWSLRTINTAVITYATTYDHGYPPSLAALGPPKTESPNAPIDELLKATNSQAAGLIDSFLASGTKSGYRFTYAAGEKLGGRSDTYTLHADPITPGVTGQRHFFTDESGVIRQETGKEANVYSPPIAE
jgi:type II secretory pathway pseudopilin PulG